MKKVLSLLGLLGLMVFLAQPVQAQCCCPQMNPCCPTGYACPVCPPQVVYQPRVVSQARTVCCPKMAYQSKTICEPIVSYQNKTIYEPRLVYEPKTICEPIVSYQNRTVCEPVMTYEPATVCESRMVYEPQLVCPQSPCPIMGAAAPITPMCCSPIIGKNFAGRFFEDFLGFDRDFVSF